MGQIFKKSLKVLLSVLMCFSVLTAPTVVRVVNAVDGEAPDHNKTLVPNGDGTYKLHLTVTGEADTTKTDAKANILIIYDVSGSMNYGTNYVRNSTGRYGYRNGEYIFLYDWYGNRLTNDYTGTAYYYNNGYYYQYTGTRYSSNRTRASEAERTIHNFIEALRPYNAGSSQTDPNVQLALVTFSSTATQVQGWTTTDATFNQMSNRFASNGTSFNLTYSGGTNWEAALQRGLQTLGNADDDPTFVIFITDGAPTQSANAGDGTAYNVAYYNAARDEARNMENYNTANHTYNVPADSNTEFYGIYAFGTEADNLDDLVYYAHHGQNRPASEGGVSTATVDTEYYYKASEPESLNAAIADIFEAIVNTLGVQDVAIGDGTTTGVQAGAEVADLIVVDETSYEYWLSMTVTGTGPYTMIRKDIVSGDNYTITVTDNGNGTVTCTWNLNGDHSVTVNGSVTGNRFRYKWEESNDLYKFDPPEAEFNESTNKVDWDLSGLGTLLDGVTYELTFDVLPSQYTNDAIAAMENDPTYWDTLPAKVKEYLLEDGTLYTNTTATLDYSDSRPDGYDDGPVNYTNPDPVPVPDSHMKVHKIWKNPLDDRTKSSNVTMDVIRDGDYEHPYESVTLDDDNDWTEQVAIAHGLIKTVKDGNGNITAIRVMTEGHDYTLTEPDNLAYYWELEMETVHPMLIDGVMTTLVLVDEDDIPTEMTASMNYYSGAKGTYYRIGDNVYSKKVLAEGAALTATNWRKGNLNIKKVVEGDIPDGMKFTFDITIDDASITSPTEDGQDIWFEIHDENDEIVWPNSEELTVTNATPETRTIAKSDATDNGDGTITYTYNGKEYTVAVKEESGDQYVYYTGSFYTSDGATFTATLKHNWNLRVFNLVSGSTYTIVEEEPADANVVCNIITSEQQVKVYKLPTNAVDNGDGTYTYENNGTKIIFTQNTETDEETGEEVVYYEYVYTPTTNTATRTTSGVIVVPSTEFAVTYTNTSYYGEAEIDVTKVLEIATGLTGPGDITEAYTFELKPVGNAPMVIWDDETETMKSVTSLIVKNPKANGGTEVFDKLYFKDAGTYSYTLTESGSVQGVTNDPNATRTVTITVTQNEDGTKDVKIEGDSRTFTNTYEAEGTAKVGFSKTLVAEAGLTPPDITGAFTFTLASTSTGAPLPTPAALPNPDNGKGEKVAYGELVFTKPGTYVYTISESGSANGVSIAAGDTQEKTITFTVSDNGDGTLKVEATLGNGVTLETLDDNTKAYIAAFTNEYKVNAITAEVQVTKNLVVPTGLKGPGDITGKYTFTLVAKDGAPVPASTSVTNPSANGGTASYGTITFTAPGTYTYEITETNTTEDDPKGVTNDSTPTKTVTFEVKDNGNGTLTVTPALGEVEFTNTYSVSPTEITLGASKTLNVLSGDNAPSVDGKYTFTLKDADGNVVGTAKTNPDGKGTSFNFDKITYTAPGEYTYTVEETGEVEGVTNDPNSSKTVTVTVVDNGDGTLSASVTAGDQISAFVNTYSVEPAGIILGASKTLAIGDGADPNKAPNVANQYELKILDAEGKVVGSAKTNPDGNGTAVYFDQITYTAPGVYTYTVTESGNVPGVTNGTTSYTVTVTVEDDGKGNLVAKVTAGSQITNFTNTYEVGETKIQLGASKTLVVESGDNAPDVTGKYTITLKDDKDNTIGTFTNKDGNGGVSYFDEITYKSAGTYTYTVTESGNVPGVENGTTSYEVVVTVTDNGDGTLTAAVTTGEAITKFKNTYKVSPTEITLGASKTLAAAEGLNAPDVSGKYTITLKDDKGNTIGTFTNKDGAGTPTNFPAITYTAPGTYTYTVTEEGTVPGVKNGTDEYEVVVTVTDNGDGTLTASVTSGEQITNFVNTYEVKPTSIVLKASKKLEAAEGLNAPDVSGKFKLILKDEKDNEIEFKMNPDGNGTAISFTALEYTKPGTYTYTVTEEGDVPGVVNDTDNPKTLVVVVTDDGKGNLSAAIQDGGSDTAAFVNTYKVSEITYELKAGKKLEVENGNNAPDVSGKYDLTLTAIAGAPLPEGAEGGKITIKNVDGNGTMKTFGTIKYTAPGEYKYTVTETGTVEGVTNGTATYNVTVKVTDKGDGTMSVAVTEGKQETLFTNTYNVKPVAVKLGASKEVVVAEGLEGPDADDVKGAYTLTLKDAEGNVIEAVTNPDGEKTPAYYQELNFDKPGTYTYTVEETGSVDGVTNGTTKYTVTIVVTDKGNGTMSVNVTGHHREIDGAYIVDFVNTYKLTQIEAELGASKLLEVAAGANNAPDVSKAYDLTLEAKDGAPMPEGAVDGKVTVKNPDGNATKVMFGKITYTLPGVYKYTVTESGTVDGVENGTASYEVKVTVTDNHNGTMSVAIDPKDGITKFVNTYKVEPTEAPIEAAKSLVGRNLKAGEFEFSLIATDENFEPLDGAEPINVKNDADGKVDFGTFDYEAAGTYYYLITEIIPDEPLEKVTYSKQQVKVTVTVTDDGHGKLAAEVAYDGGDGGKKNVFTNEYEPKPTETILSVEKTLNGRDLNAGEFEFTLTEVDAEGNPVEGGVTLTATNDGAGKVTFDAIEYTSDDDLGTHYYKVAEVKGDLGGVTYDTKEVIFIVEVTYDADEGIYVATVTKPETIEFINTYVPRPVKAAPEATKELTGRDLNAGEFEFTLTEVDAEGNPLEGGVTLTATNDAEGNIEFDEIEFDKVGVHYYKITEVKGDLGGVTYDEEAIDVTITITDDLKGNLVADVKYGTKTTFINTYVPRPVDAVLKAAKELNGRVLEDKQFAFTLKDENGELIETVYNDADGNVVFSTLTFDKVGTYVYTINEMIKDAAGYTYDTKTITVTIVVKDDLKGNLYTEITYSDEKPFVNTYEADGEAQFEVYKELEGKELEEGEFTFELRDGDGNLLQTKTNDAEGKVVFDPIAYDEADAGEVFYYTITEVDGKKPGYTYDDLLIAVTVKVTDNGDGTLTCEVNYDDEDRIFHNVFELREVAVTKVWADDGNRDGIRPESVVVKLFADGKDTGKAVVLNKDNNWYDIFKNLPKYDSKTGKLIEYTVEEEEVKGYTVKIEGDADNGYQVTNTHDSEKIEIPVEKVWKGDADYKDQVRPDMIQVMLLANGNPYEMIELSDANNWKHTFKNLFKYENGKEIEYKVSEKLETAGYTKKITGSAEEGYTITNTFKPVWGDPPVGKEIIGDKPHKVETFTFKLKAVSTTAEGLSGKMPMPEAANGAQEMTMEIEGTGTKEFGKFDMVKVGKYEYEISEVKGDAEGFTYDKTVYNLTYEVSSGENNELVLTTYVDGKKVDEIDASYFTFTNEYTAPTVEVKVTKIWDDSNNKDKIRPEAVTIRLLADGKEVDHVELNKEVKWTHTFEELPKYDGEKEIVYTVTEDEIKGYTATIKGNAKDGFTVTNFHKSVPTGVHDGSKLWMLTGGLSFAGYFFVKKRKEDEE